MPISKAERKAIAEPVVEAKYRPRIQAAQEAFDKAAWAHHQAQLGPEMLAWLDKRPSDANRVLRTAQTLYFSPPGHNAATQRAVAPAGENFILIEDKRGYGDWNSHPWPAREPVAVACEKLLTVKQERADALASLDAALKAFATVARLETEWPEIWPSVPAHLKVPREQGRALQVDVKSLNARFGLPVANTGEQAAALDEIVAIAQQSGDYSAGATA